MSKVFTRVCTLLVVFGGLVFGACTSPSSPSAVASVQPSQVVELGQLSPREVSSATMPAISPGVTDVTLANAGWTCVAPPSPFPFIICAPPGLGFPPFPPIPNNGGAPSYTLMIFTRDHQLDHHAKFLRPDLYQGQPCLGDEPWTLSARYNYNECIIPVRKNK
jgi:hypothetical protein